MLSYTLSNTEHTTALLDPVYQVWAGPQLLQPISPPSFFRAHSIHLALTDKASLAGLRASRGLRKKGLKEFWAQVSVMAGLTLTLCLSSHNLIAKIRLFCPQM